MWSTDPSTSLTFAQNHKKKKQQHYSKHLPIIEYAVTNPNQLTAAIFMSCDL